LAGQPDNEIGGSTLDPFGPDRYGPGPLPVEPLPPLPANGPPSVDVPPSPRFCTACGAPWDPASAACGGCGPAAAQSGPPCPIGGATVSAAVGLYFALLIATLVGVAVIVAQGASGVGIEFGILTAHTVLVAMWVAAAPGPVLSLLARGGGPRWQALAAAMAPATFGLATLIITAATRLPGMTQVRYAEPLLEAGYGWGMVVLCVCVQPAVVEEIAFRGVILGALRRGLTDGEALLVSTMLFAVLHLSVPSAPHLVLLGAALSWLRLRSGSLYPGMLLHFLHNGLCLLSEAMVG
jgi:membrane protease YdiL (CAAX protease family)